MTKATLLIVEDNGILAGHLKEMVIGLGYDALGPASTGEEAIALVGQHPIDLVLMDIELAGTMNGIEASTRIHAILDVPVVFLTGFSHDQYIEQASQASPYGYLVKPVSERDLAATLATSLHRHAQDLQIRESRLALEASDANFRNFFHSMTDLLLVADNNRRILDSNPMLQDTLGYDQQDLAAMSMADLYPPDRRLEADRALAGMRRGESPECRIPLQTKGGDPIPVATRFWPGTWNRTPCMYAACRDLRPEQEAEQRFEAIFRHSPVLMSLRTLEDHRLVDVNDTWLATLGYARHEVLGRTIHELGMAPFVQEHDKCMANLCKVGRLTNIEMQLYRKDRSLCNGLLSGEVVRIGGRSYILTVILDISERREWQHRLLLVAEQEREELGTELHDGLCQDLKGLEFQAALLEKRIGKRSPALRDLATAIGQQANLAVRKAYTIARDKIPIILDTGHFPKTLAALVENMQGGTEAEIMLFLQEGLLPATMEQAHHLYRIAQEALRNAVRHAAATRIELHWSRDGDYLILAVLDNGRGPTPVSPGRSKGMGLMVMRSRARTINAVFSIKQRTTQGTEIRIKVLHDKTNQSIPH